MTVDPFWTVASPLTWADPPDRISISTLNDLEACPRRWALSHAQYRGISDARYPAKPVTGAVRGRVIHAALESIAQALERAGAETMQDVVVTLTALGGLTAVIEEAVGRAIRDLPDSARTRRHLPYVEEQLRRQVPGMRQTVQFTLQRALSVSASGPVQPQRRRDGDGPLGLGYHTEVRLEPAGTIFVGIADVIRITETECEIIDYKSGGASDEHADQLKLYALLWSADERVNPDRRLADRLTLIYPESIAEFPGPELQQLDDLETEFTNRATAARASLASSPPAARVGRETCSYCQVKQLCDDYWDADGQLRIRDMEPHPIRSLQLLVTERRSRSLLLATILKDAYLDSGTAALVSIPTLPTPNPGDVIRLIDVRVASDIDGTAMVQELPTSELFVLLSEGT